jgi:hypothetical protein
LHATTEASLWSKVDPREKKSKTLPEKVKQKIKNPNKKTSLRYER